MKAVFASLGLFAVVIFGVLLRVAWTTHVLDLEDRMMLSAIVAAASVAVAMVIREGLKS